MTPALAALLYLRLILYPSLAVGFLILSIFNHFPDERRISVIWRSWLYRSLSLLFSVYGMVILLRVAIQSDAWIQFVDYTAVLPLVTVLTLLGFNILQAGKRI